MTLRKLNYKFNYLQFIAQTIADYSQELSGVIYL